MDIQDFKIFARLATVQNLSAVAAELSLTPGTVSKRLQSIEQELSVRLFDRNTRSMRITPEGTKLLARAAAILSEYENIFADISSEAGAARGRIKVAVPAAHGRILIAPAISQFAATFPEIEIEVDFTDDRVSLQEQGYDVAILSGVLDDSALKAKRLAADPQVLVAAPSYVSRRGLPQNLDALQGHDCLVLGGDAVWPIPDGTETKPLKVRGRLRSSCPDFLLQAAIDGHGIARLPTFLVRDEIAAGRLVPVLPGQDVTGNVALWAVYASGKHMPGRLRSFLDFIATWFRDPQASLRTVLDAAGRSDEGAKSPPSNMRRVANL